MKDCEQMILDLYNSLKWHNILLDLFILFIVYLQYNK